MVESQMPLLSVIIPVFNEVNTLEKVLDAVAASGLPDFQLVVVDDFSTDGTRDLLQGKLADRIDVVSMHEKNRGKGAALRTGLESATGKYVVFQDADLEYDPRELPPMLEALERGDTDVVYGSRFLHPDIREISPFWHRTVNGALTAFSNLFTGLKLTDMETCYKMMRRDLALEAGITEDRFGVEPELTAKLAGMDARFLEVPISYNRRSFEEGKKIGAKDGLRALYVIAKHGLRNL